MGVENVCGYIVLGKNFFFLYHLLVYRGLCVLFIQNRYSLLSDFIDPNQVSFKNGYNRDLFKRFSF